MTAIFSSAVKSIFNNSFYRFLLLSISLVSLPFFCAPTVLAETASQSAYIQTSYAQNTNLIPITSPHTASIALYNFYHATSCILIGQSPIAPCLEYKISKNSQGSLSSIPVLNTVNTDQGVLGLGKSILSGIYSNPPLRSTEFLTQLGKEIGLITEVHAQVGGSGNAVLSPVYKLWLVSRNIAYIAMIIIFLLVGGMVMFRQRLNPQTVITIQLALPGLVIGLVLITFSYFLASLITDMAFLGTDLIGYYFQAAQAAPNTPASLSQLTNNQSSLGIMSRMASAMGDFDLSSGINSIINNLSGSAWWYVRGAVVFLSYQYGSQAGQTLLTPVGALIGLRGGGFGGAGAGITVSQIIGSLAGGGLAASAGGIDPGRVVNFLMSFIFIAMMIYTIFKLIFKLLNNFLSIIFYTIASPFIFLVASLPGRQGLVTDWVKNMLCNVLAFPGVIGVLYFCYFLLTGGLPLQAGAQAFAIPAITPITVTGNAALPLFGGIDINLINVLLAFGAFLATPSIPDIICKAIGKIGPAAGMIEQQISGAQRSGQGYVKQATSAPGQVGKDIGGVRQLADEHQINPNTNAWVRQRVGAWNVFRGNLP